MATLLQICGVPEFSNGHYCRFSIKRRARVTNTMEGAYDTTFYENMCKSPPIGRCTTYVERKWKISQMRKEKRKARVRNENSSQQSATEDEIQDAVGEDEMHNQIEDQCDEYVPEDDEPSKKKRYAYIIVLDHPDDDLPSKYRHIRSGPRSVKPEYYIVKSILMSQYHMSDEQSDVAIMVVANYLFRHQW